MAWHVLTPPGGPGRMAVAWPAEGNPPRRVLLPLVPGWGPRGSRNARRQTGRPGDGHDITKMVETATLATPLLSGLASAVGLCIHDRRTVG